MKFQMKEFKKFGKVKWLLIVLLIQLGFNALMLSGLLSLPSPIYGGDYYYQLGQTNHVKYGGNPVESATIPGSLPGYFVLYSAIAGKIARLLNLDAIQAEFLFSYVIVILSTLIVYTLVRKVVRSDDLIAALVAFAFFSVSQMPVVKYTNFSMLVMMPLFLLVLYKFVVDSSIQNSLLLGLVYGLVALSHGVAFISASLLFGATFLYYVLWRKNFKSLIPYVIALAVGLPIALIYWHAPFFVYHGEVSPHYDEWNTDNWSDLAVQKKFVIDTVKSYLANFQNVKSMLVSLMTLVGIFVLFRKNSFIRFALIASVLITFHYLVTQNLFGIHFIPGYISSLLLYPVMTLVFAYGVHYGAEYVKKSEVKKLVYCTALFTLLALSQVDEYRHRYDNPFYSAGEFPPHEVYSSLGGYLVNSTSVNDVILTTKEIGFAVNALSGRKLVITRRAQNDPFLDMDPRELDAAIILYGNDKLKRLELIEKYNINYFYWDGYWLNSEFDPLMLFYSPENEEILNKYGIIYIRDFTWVDPAMQGDNYRKFDLLIITPDNYYSLEHPWHPDLDPYLEKVWNFTAEGQEAAALYKIHTSPLWSCTRLWLVFGFSVAAPDYFC